MNRGGDQVASPGATTAGVADARTLASPGRVHDKFVGF